MQPALKESAEVPTFSLGFSFETLAASSHRLRRLILRIDVANIDRRLLQVWRRRTSEVCKWLKYSLKAKLSVFSVWKSRANPFRQRHAIHFA